jgi:predicted phosphoribosyltransferase
MDLPELRNRVGVFRDRTHAGEVLSGMLQPLEATAARVLAVPAGGVPVAAAIAQRLQLPLDVAVVSKITLPWNTEVGYGAVAGDGTVQLNTELIQRLALNDAEVERAIAATRAKVAQRIERFRTTARYHGLERDVVILVDDGLASGYTLYAAVEALYKAGARRLIVAVPTGHAPTVERLASRVEALYCANVRDDHSFAVAEAYRQWSDVDEETAAAMLEKFRTE